MPAESRKIPSVHGLALKLLLEAYGWTARELAAAVGLTPSALSQLMHGDVPLPMERLAGFAAAMGVRPGAVEEAAAAAHRVLAALGVLREEEASGEEPGLPGEPTAEERWAVERAAGGLAERAPRAFRALLYGHLGAERVEGERRAAAELGQVLRRETPAGRRALVECAREYHTWAVVEWLAHESARVAGKKADLALEWAGLAVAAAARVQGSRRRRALVRAYALAFLANSERVKGWLRRAERTFGQARKLWDSAAAGGTGPLDGVRLLDLEASLRRDQRRFAEALDLLEQALAGAADDAARARILLKRSATLQQMGDPEEAVAALRQAAPLVDGEREPRQLCVLNFNLASTLCDLGRSNEAEPLLAPIRALALRLANRSDLTRTLWLQGKIDAGRGRWQEAAAALAQVREDFRAEEMGYDYALATLELAAVRAEQGRYAAVKALARQALPVFVTERVEREALAVVQLFVEAAARDELSAALAWDLVAQLRKLRPGA